MTIHIYFTTDIFSSFFLVAWVHAKLLQLCLTVTSWTVAHQLPLSMGVSSQEYWSDYHAFLQGIFLTWDVGWTYISCVSCIAGRFFTSEPLGKPFSQYYFIFNICLFSLLKKLY